MKKWLMIVVILLVASFSISYGFESEPSVLTSTGENLCCVSLSGEYYGKSCTKIDRITYLYECEYHYCEVVNNSYYDRAGNIVNKETFIKECPDVNIANNLEEISLENIASWLWESAFNSK